MRQGRAGTACVSAPSDITISSSPAAEGSPVQRRVRPQIRAAADCPGHWPAGGCQSSTLFPSASMTPGRLPVLGAVDPLGNVVSYTSRKALMRAGSGAAPGSAPGPPVGTTAQGTSDTGAAASPPEGSVLVPAAGVRPESRSNRFRVSRITRFGARLNKTLAATHTKPRTWWPYQRAAAMGGTDAASSA